MMNSSNGPKSTVTTTGHQKKRLTGLLMAVSFLFSMWIFRAAKI